MDINRRQWLKNTSFATGLALFGCLGGIQTLTAEERKKFNPRPFTTPVRLSSNENPYGPSARVQEAVNAIFANGCRYPYKYADELAILLAEKEGVTKDHIVITGGSTEGLKISGITFAANGGEIIAAEPTFLAMMEYAQMWGANVTWVPVDENKGYNLNDIEKKISGKTKMVFLCNPNNPTGTLLPAQTLVDFCTSISKKTTVFSDEAYYDYIEEPNYPSMVELVKNDENIIVSRTFSKVYGLAGMRIGYLIARPDIASKLRDNVVAMSNVYAIEAAKEALKDDEFYQFSLKKTKEAKQLIYNTLDELKLPYVKSHANFVFFQSGKNINELGAVMLAKGVQIGRAFPPFLDWCRISTGTLEEVQLFNAMLKDSL